MKTDIIAGPDRVVLVHALEKYRTETVVSISSGCKLIMMNPEDGTLYFDASNATGEMCSRRFVVCGKNNNPAGSKYVGTFRTGMELYEV